MFDSELNRIRSQDTGLSYSDSVEVSAGFFPDKLPVFLWCLPNHIKEDFGGDQIKRVVRLADSMKLNDSRGFQFYVTFRGRRVPFRVTLCKYQSGQDEAIGLYIKTVSGLARVIEEEVKAFYAQATGLEDTSKSTEDQKPKKQIVDGSVEGHDLGHSSY